MSRYVVSERGLSLGEQKREKGVCFGHVDEAGELGFMAVCLPWISGFAVRGGVGSSSRLLAAWGGCRGNTAGLPRADQGGT